MLTNREKITLTPTVIVKKVTIINNRLFYKKYHTSIALENDLAVFVKEVTNIHDRILFVSYSLDSTILLYASTDIYSRARA